MDAKLIMTVEQMKDRDVWRQTRNLGIGGSDAGAIMGMNPWKSKYQLWLEKTGQAEPEDISGKESVYWGTVLEAPVADRFAELTGKKIRRAGMMQNVKDPWMLANVDRLIVGEKEEAEGLVSVRAQGEGDKGQMTLEAFRDYMTDLVSHEIDANKMEQKN